MPPLPPVTRRIVGMMTVLAGFMLLVAFFLRMGLTYYAYKQAGPAAIYNREFLMSLLLLAGSGLLLRYGWRTWRPENDRLG
ncbi:hypothetical protein [Hymenobacter canadensis]|uniref:Uncharacterized protein n=1 Tax=Hymenobacter canadensis TaxID=2999067 RepID=A0ABY7LJS3_9BACT|nr:hypothetical protein [Hymenobacter canadensis]WBA40618.1 hypothetical protein O3303_12370 [Hymenobacter canadensis]